MQCIRGKVISCGIVAEGKVFFYDNEATAVALKRVDDSGNEIKRYLGAVRKVMSELDELYEKAILDLGREAAEIFMAQKLIVCDEEYKTSVEYIINSKSVCAEYAVKCTKDKFMAMFNTMEDEYFRVRSADVKDASERVISALAGNENGIMLTEPSIIVAKELTPSEIVNLDKRMVLGFVLENASANSHAAILARTMGISMITDVKPDRDWDGKNGVIDAKNGLFYVEPEEKLLVDLRKIRGICCQGNSAAEYIQATDNKMITAKDGRIIRLCANINSIFDAKEAIAAGADGAGLLRTELLFLGRKECPTEEEQLRLYKELVVSFAGKPVIIRTLDIGADKTAGYIEGIHENNPALGVRGIRLCFEKEDIFKTQLRAILRAAQYGMVGLMFPMITTTDEVIRAKKLVGKAEAELASEKLKYGKVKIGIMIETPAAALMSAELAELVDFFSIGTNDLTQYTLAADRQNGRLAGLYDENNPAVIKLIEMVIKNAHEKGIKAGICGEAAAVVEGFAGKLIDMGIDEISVSPAYISKIRKVLLED